MKTFLHAILFASALFGAVTFLATRMIHAYDYHVPSSAAPANPKTESLVPGVVIDSGVPKSPFETPEPSPIVRPVYKTDLVVAKRSRRR